MQWSAKVSWEPKIFFKGRRNAPLACILRGISLLCILTSFSFGTNSYAELQNACWLET